MVILQSKLFIREFKSSAVSHIQSSVALPESMTFPENFDTTIFSVKIMHLCIYGRNAFNEVEDP